MKTCLILLALLALLAPALPAADATPDEDGPLTLKDCIRTALTNYTSVKIASEQVRVAELDKETSRAPLMPKVTFDTYYTKGQSTGGQSGFSVRRTGEVETKQTTVSYTQTYLDGGKTRLAEEKAGYAVDNAQDGYSLARQDLAWKVSTAYFDYLKTIAVAKYSGEEVERTKYQLDMVKARIAAGDAAEVDRYQLEVEHRKAQLSFITAHNNVRQKSNGLRYYMGLPPGEALAVTYELREPAQTPALEECRRSALRQRPEIQQLESTLASSRTDRSLVDLQNRPLFNVSGNYGQGLGDWSPMGSQWSVTADFSFLIFDGGMTTRQLKRAESQIAIASERLTQMKQDVILEVEQNHIALDTAREKIPASQALLESADRNLKAAEAKYRAGLATTLEIIQARVDYHNAELDLMQAWYDYYTARSALLKSMGAELPEE